MPPANPPTPLPQTGAQPSAAPDPPTPSPRRAGYAWPAAAPRSGPLPDTLPDGSPWPKISIVTPTYNQAQYIEQTLQSVLSQGYPNLEHILIDGASTDHTMQVVEKYRTHLARVVSEKDGGQSNAINKGMKLATGEILTWLNSDDLLAPGALYAVALAFHTTKADLVSGITLLHNAPPQSSVLSPQSSHILSRHLTAQPHGPLSLEALLDLDHQWAQGAFWYQPETFFTKALWEKAGGHVDESLHYSMDYDLWLRFAEQGAVLHVVGRPLALYRVHENQKTFQQTDYQPELKKVRDHFLSLSPSVPQSLSPSPDKSSLRIVFFNDFGNTAGAGIAHARLAAAAAIAGHDVIPIAIAPRVTQTQRTPEELLRTILSHAPDLVVLGNVHSAGLGPELLALLSPKVPTIQVTHDLWPLTGRCGYPNDCTKYLTGCDHTCPTQNEYPVIPGPTIRPAWESKYRTYTSEDPPALAAVSAYTEHLIRTRFAHPPHCSTSQLVKHSTPPAFSLRYGLDTTTFKPRDKQSCRELLSLPEDKFIVLFSSSTLSDKRKGLAHLLEALDQLNLPDLLAVAIGHFDPGQSKSTRFHSMGYVSDPHTLALLYSAADVFVGPSMVETFGQVFIESAACGTPSIGYATAGGVAEAIAHNLSGLLASEPTPAALAAALETLYHDDALRARLGQWGRLWVENEFSLNSAAHRFTSELLRSPLNDKLKLRPNLTLHPHAAPRSLVYLDAPDHKSLPLPAVNGDANVGHLRARLATVEADRDALRKSLHDVTHTRLWRMVDKAYPTYVKFTGDPRLPRPIQNAIASIGRFLSKRT